MHSSKRSFRNLILPLLFSLSGTALATDITLPFRSWSQLEATASPFDPDDPIGRWLMMEEVDIWGRIRNGFAMPDLDHPLVATHTQWFATRPEYFERTTPRAARYLYHVVQELEKRGMPSELALLPFIESAFNPYALSSAKAAGLWQFIPSTGREYNLTQSIFMDERRSVIASTDAALTYLQKLYDMFGDWHLALAAYNWGEGSVQRAIRRAEKEGRPTTFNGISRYMPAETRNYVPKLQALKNVIAAPEQYTLTLPKVDNRPYFVKIEKNADIDIQVAAQLAELSVEEFKALNPQFTKPVIPAANGAEILLPRSHAEKFRENLAQWGRALSSWTVHTVTSAREKIETIAMKFGTTPEVIREVNNIPPRMALASGSTILVPKPAAESDQNISAAVLESAKLVVVPEVQTVHVRVSKKDTLSSIARRYKVSVAQIKSWNNLSRDVIRAGQTLTLYLTAGSSKSATPAPKKAKKAAAKQARKKV